jgi:hypothetical protein
VYSTCHDHNSESVKFVEFKGPSSFWAPQEIYKSEFTITSLATWNGNLTIGLHNKHIVRLDSYEEQVGIEFACDLMPYGMRESDGFIFCLHNPSLGFQDTHVTVWNEDGLLVQKIGAHVLKAHGGSIITSIGNTFSVWKTNPWSTKIHRKFPAKVRKMIRAVMSLRTNTGALISTLPKDILYFIFSIISLN